ncbi:MAG: RDD family protein [Ekhidna sp.]
MHKKESRFAGFSTRLLAHNIDLIVILPLLYGVSFIISRSGYDLFLFSGIYLLYHSCFEASAWQATPGKRFIKIKVVGLKNEKTSFLKILSRNSLKVVSLIVFFSGFIMIVFHEKKQSFHDFIVGTLVLFNED